MKKYRVKFLGILILASIPIILAGCIPKANLTDTQDAGRSQFAKGGVVPGFPPVPIYPKAKIIESVSSGVNFGASAYSEDSLDKVIDFYSNAFIQIGWENNVTVQSENHYLFEFRSQVLKGTVIVNPASDNKHTAITIATSPR